MKFLSTSFFLLSLKNKKPPNHYCFKNRGRIEHKIKIKFSNIVKVGTEINLVIGKRDVIGWMKERDPTQEECRSR